MKSAIIILAAGSSSRMGQSKQLLKVGDDTLLMRAVRVARASGNHPTIVVLGAEEDRHRKEIETLGVDVVHNSLWKTGMGSSLKTGLQYVLKKFPNVESVVVMVCDQPLLTADHLKKLISKHETTGKAIIASQYDGVAGVPALFGKITFQEIKSLPDDQGAKKIIQQHFSEVITVAFPEGAVDLDTPEDYRGFIKGIGKK